MAPGFLMVMLVMLAVSWVPTSAHACVGDCDSNGRVTIAELVEGSRTVLGSAPPPSCPNLENGGEVGIAVEDLVTAVVSAGRGCALPTVTASPSPTVSPTPAGFAGTIAELFPHAVGDTLVYRLTEDGEVTEETNEVVQLEAGNVFVVDSRSEDVHEKRQYVDSVQQLALTITDNLEDNVRTTCTPGSLLLQLPLREGQSYERFSICEVRTIVGGRRLGGYRQDNRVTLVRHGGEVTVPAGTYRNVLHVSLRIDFSGGGSGSEQHEIDIVPGVGAIRQHSVLGRLVTLRELIDGTVGGRSVRP